MERKVHIEEGEENDSNDPMARGQKEKSKRARAGRKSKVRGYVPHRRG